MDKLTFTCNKTVLLSVVFCLSIIIGFAQSNIPPKPNPIKFYNNLSKTFPNFLSPKEAQSIELKLKAFSDSTSNQIVVVVIDTLNGLEPWAFATELGEKWSPGQEKEDNGVVILIKPTGETGQRKTFIATGRGLEAVIPDFTCLEIVNTFLIPNFKNGNFYLGIDKATNVLMSLALKEFNYTNYPRNTNSTALSNHSFFISFIIFFFSIIAFLLPSLFIICAFFLVFLTVSRSGGRATNFSSTGYRSRSTGFRGSSFGGSSFGGGSFGGGGAGGSW